MNIDAVKQKLLKQLPVYSNIINDTKFIEDNSVLTVATNGKEIFYNINFIKTFNEEEIIFSFANALNHNVDEIHKTVLEQQENSSINIDCDNLSKKMYFIKKGKGEIMEKQIVSYEDALTDNEILKYATIIDKFKKNKINYKTLKAMFLNEGIEVRPNNIFHKKLLKDAEAQKERALNEEYLYTDINGFILIHPAFKCNVSFNITYKAIELLANSGNCEYKDILISILKTQLKHSYDVNPIVAAKRSKFRRQIIELEKELEEKDYSSKTK